MAWCPKCKMEYREGITICADCGTPLVENYTEEEEQVSVLLTDNNELAQRFHNFLEYSEIKGALLGSVEETGEYSVSVPASKEKEAKKLFKGFYLTELEKAAEAKAESMNEASEDASSEEEQAEAYTPAAGAYVKKEEKYKDFSSTAWTFLVVGIGGLVFTVLNILGYITLFNNPVSYTALLVMFSGCLLVSVSSFKSAKKAQGEIAEENRVIEDVKEWMENNIHEADLLPLQDDTVSDEINFLNKINYIKNAVTEQFGKLDEAFLDEVTEEFYNTHMEDL